MFLIWPFGGFLWSFKNYKFYSSRNLLWLFCGFVGLTFTYNVEMDSQRYVDELHLFNQLNFINIFDFFEYILIDEDTKRFDFIQPLITYIVSIFSDEGNVLICAFGLFFGYFYSRNVWFLIDQVKTRIKIEALVYFILFFILVPIWNINGFRYWAATHVFIFGVIEFVFFDKKVKGWSFIVLSVFIHDTFIISILLFWGVSLFRSRIAVHYYFYIYLFSVIFNSFGTEFIKNSLESFTILGIKNREAYLNEQYAEQLIISKSTLNFYIKYQYSAMKALIGGTFIWIYYYRRNLIIYNSKMLDTFCVGLIFLAFTNFVADVPSMERFYYIGFMMIALFLFLFFQNNNFKRRPDWYKVLSVLIIGYLFISKMWMGLFNLTVATFLSNPFTTLFFEYNESMADFIKRITN
jgi:hypothetical protein